MLWTSPALAGFLLACQQYRVAAQPTWPASIDDLEDILLLHSGYRARGFNAGVTPCSAGVAPGRNTAAEWIRTAFHDMAPGSVYNGIGGLDGSIVFETRVLENVGAGFESSLLTYAPFFSSRTSLADLIAAGAYTATRSCGGPILTVRGGRKDATSAGPLGAPVPQNSIGTFQNQFLRMGYNSTEMIEFVVCGHTLGGVHAVNFPEIVDAGAFPNDYAHFDTSVSNFDNKVVTEYLDGTTRDPLVVGKSVAARRHSDFVVFSSGNATVRTLADSAAFASRCKVMFEKMIDLVPRGVTLTDPITPYEVKPYDVQLTLLDGGSKIRFTGDIRIRTTRRTGIALVRLVYKDRTGAAVSTPIDTSSKGSASGFDETFSFFGFDTELLVATSISSFNVVIQVAGGTTEAHDNNGNGFPVDDTIIYQAPQSCLDGSGKLTVVAAVRQGAPAPSVRVVVKNPRASPVVIPALSTASAAMATQTAIGSYQLFSADYTFSGSQAQSAVFDVFAGLATDAYKTASGLPTACKPLGTSEPTPTPPSGSRFQGCYYDAGAPRALAGAANVDGELTVAKCATFCSSYQYFGLEYSRECYCGNTLDATSHIVALADCNMPCAGNSAQTCGAGNRISLYRNTQYSPPTNPPINGYRYAGCYSEGTNQRALSDDVTASDTMTVSSCASFCNGSKYFGVEYGRECYCGATLNQGAVEKDATECNMLCAGNGTQFCGAGNRLNVYEKLAATSSSSTPTTFSSSPPSSSTELTPSVSATPITISESIPASSSSSTAVLSSSISTPTPTPTPTGPSFPGYDYTGCVTDRVEHRSLTGKSRATDDNSYATCAYFCGGYQYFGVEYGRECFCGDRLPTDASANPDSECSMPCAGDSTQICGDASRLTVFKSLDNLTPSNPLIPGYNYTGCYTDSVGARVLRGSYLYDGSNLTIAKCAQFCNGANFFGTQYGSECYCGNEFSAETTEVDQEECSFVCSGDTMELCGAGNRLSLWEKLT